MKIKIIVLLAILVAGCTEYKKQNDRIVIAKVGEKYLYLDQVPAISSNAITSEDSISIVRNFKDRWIKRELLLGKAEENLSTEYQNEIDQKIEESKANLMIYQYQQQMMYQKMDTLVPYEMVLKYYNDNVETLNLSAPIVKAVFIKVHDDAPNIENVRKWYRSSNQEDLQSLESYCYQFADKYDDFGEQWINFNYLLRELPNEIDDPGRFLRSHNYFEDRDSLFYYFVNIREYKLKGTVAPIEYVSQDIKNIILNNRKIEFLQNLEDGIYNEALRENAFKVY
jgi:hypothetical protein